MSMDRSLRSKATLERHRNVLSRAERIQFLTEDGRWEEGRSVLHLPKVSHRKVAVGKKDKAEKKPEEAAAAVLGAAVAPAAAEKPAKSAKPAKPTK